MNGKKLLVVGAHSADWIWRSSGTIAKYVANGAEVQVVCLSYGVRGESASLWVTPGQTVENVKNLRYQEALDAANSLGVAKLEIWDFDDCMLEISSEVLQKLNEKIREFNPSLIITHDEKDNINPDHGFASEIVYRAAIMATQNGIPSNELEPVGALPIYGFEASESERSGFIPDIYIDITAVYDKKLAAMHCVKAQKLGPTIHERTNAHRGFQASRYTGNKDTKYCEAFRMRYPLILEELPTR